MAASIDRPVILRRRPDLQVTLQRYEGRSYQLIKDPVGLKYYRFQEEEYKILDLLDGIRSLKEIKDLFEAEFIPQKITLTELQQFIGRLHETGLGHQRGRRSRRKTASTGRENREKKNYSQHSPTSSISSCPASIPSRYSRWLYPRFKWVYTPTALAGVILLAISALTLVLINFQEFQGRPEMESFPCLLQYAQHHLVVDRNGIDESHPRIRPRADMHAFRGRMSRDGHAVPRALARAVLQCFRFLDHAQ